MARIDLENLAHSYHPRPGGPGDYAVKPTSLTWDDGGAYALLGPSGCGKTTLLNIISGLTRPTQGRVVFDGKDVTALPPQERRIAQVFQFPVVYDTMTVFDNLAFPLRNLRKDDGWDRARIRKRVQEVAEILELTGDLGRRARGLSADAKQKVSLGRGLVRPDVAALLLDEPLTVIDPGVKWLLRRQLKQVHHQLAVSLIYVTHDQTEAMTFADRVVVMNQGEVVQTGTPRDLFEAPAHTFVGHFIGNPGMNFLPGDLAEGLAPIGVGPAIALSAAGGQPGLRLGIRPEFVRVSGRPAEGAHPAQVLSVQPLGSHTLVAVQLQGHRLWAKLPPEEGARLLPGAGWVRLPREHILLYANERRVA
jgi:glycerol transport system ATP-binding protein